MLLQFKMNPDTAYQNRIIQKRKDALLFDGYSIWLFGDKTPFEKATDFTLEFEFAPYGVSSEGDAVFSCLDRKTKEGLELSLEQDGKARVRIGFGNQLIEFASIKQNITFGKWNHLIVIYRYQAGWCDLVINGVISNRVQFGRYRKIKWPKCDAFLGRKADQANLSPQMGVFWGWMRKAKFLQKAVSFEHAKAILDSVNLADSDIVLKFQPDRNRFAQDVDRPQYHLIEPDRWMNEPHGPVFYNGYYHIFYQANLHAPIWDFIQWGHLISVDMVHWKDLPQALQSERGFYDEMGCWSGSAMVDKAGKPRIYYTAGDNNRFPNQAVAMAQPQDVKDDPLLKKWVKYPSLIKEQDLGWWGEFRDPFVWLEQDTYFMLVGTGDEHNGGGNAALYVSEDGIDWKSVGMLVEYDYSNNQEGGHVWELPVLLPLRDLSGHIVCHIMMFCACQIEKDIVEVYYFLGNWDAASRKFTKWTDRMQLLDLGHGTFTGPSGFVTPDNRSVVFTIAQGKRSFVDEYHAGWAHNGGLPLELWWDNGVRMQPVREVLSCKEKRLLSFSDITPDEAEDALCTIASNRLYMKLCVKGECLAVDTKNESGTVRIVYDKMRKRLSAFDYENNEISRYRDENDLVEVTGDIEIEYFLDHSMIEVYVNQKKAMTLRNYAGSGERRISLRGTDGIISSLELWQMKSAYDLRID